MRLTSFIIFWLYFTEFVASSQNLISNSSFDEYYNYFDTNNNLVYHPTDWYYVDSLFNHPIYFSTDRYLNNSLGWNIHPDSALINRGQIANYISVLILPNTQKAYTALKKPLKQGKKYRLNIDVKALDQSNYFSDLLVGFQESLDSNMDSCLYQLKLVIPDSLCNEILYHKWFTFSNEFIATGMEQVLIITSGSIADYMKIINDNKEKFLIQKFQGPPKLKYYIDNPSLFEECNNDSSFAVEIDTLEIGESIILNNIYFDFDKYELLQKSFPELDLIYNYLFKNKNVNILISGHTDNYGSEDYNDILSLKRALSVKEYLTNRGIGMDRLQAKGFGAKFPIETNITSIGRQKNRRIQLQLIKK